MPRHAFFKMVPIIQPYLHRQNTNMRLCIPPNKRLAITLHYLSEEGKDWKTAKFFVVGKSYVSVFVIEVCWIMTNVIGHKFIKCPKIVSEYEYHVLKFEQTHNFPQFLGALDGTHINIRAPTENYVNFVNRKGRK